MSERELAEMLLRDHLLAAAALTSMQLSQLSDCVNAQLDEVLPRGAGYVDIRTRIEAVSTEVALEREDGSEALRLTRMMQRLEGSEGLYDSGDRS